MNISQEQRVLLDTGKVAARNLAEALAIDFATLLSAAVPAMPSHAVRRMKEAASTGIVQRMRLAGELLYNEFGLEIVPQLKAHTSDTVRGWACFTLAMAPNILLEERLETVRESADDAHFGVREWAWLVMRPYISENLEEAVSLLSLWTQDPSERIRRFASEATRPRGVWCAHISSLKSNPELGLPILEPLCGDASAYVQDSVGNWLNDASKTQPHWVRDVCERWRSQVPGKGIERICKRALRSINK